MPLLSSESLVKPSSPRQMRDSDIIIKDQDGLSNCLEVSDFAYSNSELVNFENAAVNIDNSSDVIIGPVTQFNVNGNVTIVQNGSPDGDEKEKEKTFYEQKFPEKCETGNESSNTPTTTKKKLKHRILRWWIVLFAVIIISVPGLFLLYSLKYDHGPPPPQPEPEPEPKPEPDPDNDPPKIFDKETWGGKAPLTISKVETPAKLVVIKDTRGDFCTAVPTCKELTKQLQDEGFDMDRPDISYNFLVGGDGNVYVGRGFGVKNHESDKYVDIAMHGNFCYDSLISSMIDAAKYLIQQGIDQNFISKDYKVICHNQTSRIEIPVDHLCTEVSKWEHFSNMTYF